MTNPKVGVLCDKFDQGSINSALWTTPFVATDTVSDGDYGTVATLGSASIPTVFTPDPACGISLAGSVIAPAVICGNGTGLGSVIPYDLTSSGISVQLISYAPTSAYVGRFALCNNNASSIESVSWFLSGSQIRAEYNNPGEQEVVEYTYNSTTASSYRFVRIRESGGTVYWDYSSDGVTWTNAGSVSDPFDLTGMYVSLYGAYTSGSGAGAVTWANVDYVL